MTNKAPKSSSPASGPSPVPEAPAASLARPQALKSWSRDLVGILQKEEKSIFDGWDYRDGVLTRDDFTRTLRKMLGCGSVVELRSKFCRDTGEISEPVVHAANYCGSHAVCPYCAARVQDRRRARFREPIREAARIYKRAYLVTATIPWAPNWAESINNLLESWKSFRLMGQVRRRKKKDGTIVEKRSGGEFGKVLAGLAKVEIKRGEGSGMPHCHIHGLFFTNDYLNFQVWSPEEKAKDREDRESLFENNGTKISREWNKATDGAATGLDCKLIKHRPPKKRRNESTAEYRKRAADWSLSDSVFEQSREVLKYATKFESNPETAAASLFAKDFFGIKSATYGRRLFFTYGAFREVSGNDFIGSPCPLKEKPIIYQTRWRADRYAPLIQRDRPLFPNTEPDPGPGVTHRLRVLNRSLGATRRTRRAINEAKRAYLENGRLTPAVWMRREYLPEGGFKDFPVILEMPGYIVNDPDWLGGWERWMDESITKGREAYVSAREDLDRDERFKFVGTPEERAAEADFLRRFWWRTEAYQEDVTRLFLRTLQSKIEPSTAPP